MKLNVWSFLTTFLFWISMQLIKRILSFKRTKITGTAESSIPAFVVITNSMEENINVNLTLQDSTGVCDIPEYPIPAKNKTSKPVPLSCLPLLRIDVVISGGGGCSYTLPQLPPLVPPPFEVISKTDGSGCEIVPPEG